MESIKLVKASQNLLNQANKLEVIEKLIELVENSRVTGDTYAVNHFLQMNALDLIIENISSVRKAISQVSDSIYPNSGGNEDENK